MEDLAELIKSYEEQMAGQLRFLDLLMPETEQQERIKFSEYIDKISHEIRTPLTTVVGGMLVLESCMDSEDKGIQTAGKLSKYILDLSNGLSQKYINGSYIEGSLNPLNPDRKGLTAKFVHERYQKRLSIIDSLIWSGWDRAKAYDDVQLTLDEMSKSFKAIHENLASCKLDLDEDGQEIFDNILEAAERGVEYVVDVKDLSDVLRGDRKLEYKEISIQELFTSQYKALSREAAEKNIMLDMRAVNGERIMADRTVSKVVLNLLSNAIKYSDPDKTIKVRVLDRGDSYEIRITDQGYGFREHDIPKIGRLHNRFHTYNPKTGEQISGYGVGLNLCCQIMAAHGKRFGLEHTEYGKGSTFAFTADKAA